MARKGCELKSHKPLRFSLTLYLNLCLKWGKILSYPPPQTAALETEIPLVIFTDSQHPCCTYSTQGMKAFAPICVGANILRSSHGVQVVRLPTTLLGRSHARRHFTRTSDLLQWIHSVPQALRN